MIYYARHPHSLHTSVSGVLLKNTGRMRVCPRQRWLRDVVEVEVEHRSRAQKR